MSDAIAVAWFFALQFVACAARSLFIGACLLATVFGIDAVIAGSIALGWVS